MSQSTSITDRSALTLHRARTRAEALFLHDHVADELHERLEEVNRSFTSIAIVTGHSDFWTSHFPAARIVPDDELLDLESAAYDLIIHAMALHWANDPVGQLVQCRRALRPDGLCLVALLGGQTLHELRTSLASAEVQITGGLSPRIAPMGEIRDLGGLLGRAGFALPVADTTTLMTSYRDLFQLMRDLRHMGETNALTARHKTTPPRQLFLKAAELYAEKYPATDDHQRIQATFEVCFLTGWAPDDSQQKPLRPGSATGRLADALGTRETRLTDQDTPTQD